MNQKIIIISLTHHIYLRKSKVAIPFLYSNKQIINIEREKETYNLNFQILEYNGETIFLQISENGLGYKYIMLDNCNVEEENLLCKVQKEQFLEVLSNNTQNITLNFYDYEILQTKFDSVLDITINNKIEQKEDVYIELTAIKQNYINWMNLIIYETNVSSISNVFSDIFYLDFYWKPNTRLDKQRCFLKKIPEQPLLLFCLISFEQKINIFLNETEQYFNNISIKYNFILLPMQNILYFNVLNYGCHIFYEYPPTLNFYDKEEFIIYFHIEGNDKTNDIKLHPESNNLKCELKYFPGNIIKACDITINDFKGKNSSYYNIYYQNYTKNYSLLYNLSPIKVLLPKENEIF